ncbi:MAG: TetR/AcrR family transcriptional regulator [Propionibacteriaceae bacterium]|nr:WHG domain-containing protein [Micropruina sp.]HBY24219.1 TetR family transcriptional regulator [Propionibacteriaceae bacterium]
MTGISDRSSYHHGDLRATLVSAGMAMLEESEPFSLRALARRAGVSPTAPYRHFPDREALESALAVEGLRALMVELAANGATPTSSEQIAELAVRYVRFALARPALFRLMFGRECDDQDDDRVRAAGALHAYLAEVLGRVYPNADSDILATAGWSTAHGLAFLHLDGKLPNSDPAAIDARVRATFAAILPPASSTHAPQPS